MYFHSCLFSSCPPLKLVDVLWAGLQDSYVKMPMAITAEKLGGMYNVTREQCDEFALTSQQRWANGEREREREKERERERTKGRRTVINESVLNPSSNSCTYVTFVLAALKSSTAAEVTSN